MAFVESVWWMLVLIGIMIVIHELGHYWAARYFDVKIDAFAIGFGPRLFGIRRGETDWKVCFQKKLHLLARPKNHFQKRSNLYNHHF